MDLHSKTLVELQQLAKVHRPRIKRYYIISRVDLIRILSLRELPESYIIEKLTINELRKQAKEKEIPKIWSFKRAELVELLYPDTKQNNQNDDGRKEHDHPKQHEGE